jgi:hypothetical protein
MHIKYEVLTKGSFNIKDVTNARFWNDTWVGDKPLKVKYPSLYNIVCDPHATNFESDGHKPSKHLF